MQAIHTMHQPAPPKPRGFSLRRYPANLHKYFPAAWLAGTRRRPQPPQPLAQTACGALAAALPETILGAAQLCRLLHLNKYMHRRAIAAGLPYEWRGRRHLYHTAAVLKFLAAHPACTAHYGHQNTTLRKHLNH